MLDERVLKRVPHDLFKFPTADENGSLEGSVGADHRAATNLTRAVAATERCSHIKTRIFTKTAHLPSRFSNNQWATAVSLVGSLNTNCFGAEATM
jgi:hypothetical protein